MVKKFKTSSSANTTFINVPFEMIAIYYDSDD